VRRRVIIVTAGAALAVGGVVLAPQLLRRIDFFGVRQVELVGVRYLAPEQVLAALRLGEHRNLFDPTGPIVERAEALPGIVRAKVDRRLPGTLRVIIVERTPVAFVPTNGGLIAVDSAMRPLPFDPSATGFDLPVLQRADTIVVHVLAAIRTSDSVLFQQVDAARRGSRATVVLELGEREVLLGTDPTPERLRAVEAVRRHLERTGTDFSALDGRFTGWIVVRKGQA
jgi:cell division protein FtsQ